MKKIFIIFSTASLLFSCKKLDENSKGFIVQEQFYKTQQDAISAVTSVYGSLTTDDSGEAQALYARNLFFLVDMGSDNVIAGPAAANPNVRAISAITYISTNDRVQVAWRQLYKGISRSNAAIDRIPEIEFDNVLRTRLINEAKFLRALFYFDAVRLWGGVPIVLHEPTSPDVNNLKVPRATVDQVYEQIIADLTDAENLPATYTSADAGRATSGSAKALLAKVYLTRKDWKNAILKAREVITGPFGYDLFENYGDVYNKATKNGKEHIFSAQFEPNTVAGGGSGSFFMIASFAGFTGNSPADMPADSSIYKAYGAGDTRKDVSFYTSLINPATGLTYNYPQPLLGKYIDRTILTTGANSAINFPIIRLSDILLTLAEAINEDEGPTTEAYEAINQVLRRAYARPIHTPGSDVDLTGLGQEDFRQAVYLQRNLEFTQESQRWFDLVRTGRLVEELKKVPSKIAVSEKNNLYPIPQNEININPEGLPQNPGYN